MTVANSSINKVLVGRQAIFGPEREVFAYELLYRNGESNQANITDGDQSTARVMLNSLLEIGLDRIVGGNLAFINMTTGFILGNCCEELPKNQAVLEVLEDVQANPEVVAALTRLSSQGYQIALDDFSFREDLLPLVEIAHIIKLDVMAMDREELQRQIEILQSYPVKLLAEKVETQEDFDFCKELGFEYFQGFFFCRPNIVEGTVIPANQTAILTLLARLQDPGTGMQELEDIIRQDLSLSHKVLKYVNSAFFALPKSVDSIRQAACMVGAHRLKTWATLITLASIGNKPFELLGTSLVRAKMCEQLALARNHSDTEQFFTVGMFSVLDGLFDQPLSQLIGDLKLSPDVTSALLEYGGILGKVLEYVIAYERGNWESIESMDLEESAVRDSYLEAIEWMASLVPLLKA
jgi:EAL and modified HD-GYP domain-containing signal transduction protein